MTVTVAPQEFKFVQFDAAHIARIGEQLTQLLAIDRPVHIDVDETTPLGRIAVELGDTITVRVQSGAFEDSRKPREQSEANTSVNLGRALLRARDRLHGGFGEAPADTDLSLRQVAAWETYCVGRLARLGLQVNEQRWRYNFRNRHGFNDESDVAFDQIWTSDGLTWGELEAISTTGAERATAKDRT